MRRHLVAFPHVTPWLSLQVLLYLQLSPFDLFQYMQFLKISILKTLQTISLTKDWSLVCVRNSPNLTIKKKQTVQLENGQNGCTEVSVKRICRWHVSTWEGHQCHCTDIREKSTKTATCYTLITIVRTRTHTHTCTVKAYRKQRQKDCSKFKA